MQQLKIRLQRIVLKPELLHLKVALKYLLKMVHQKYLLIYLSFRTSSWRMDETYSVPGVQGEHGMLK